MNIRELYEKGQAWFRFSDGETRRVIGKGASGSLLFEVTSRGGTEQHHIYYYENGRPNLGGTFPTVVGVAEDESMSEQRERSKRGEIRRAIESAVNRSCNVDDETYENIVDNAMIELDGLVERWTDEETAEDLDKSIRKSEVYEGMRVQIVAENDSDRPYGATGTIVKDDKDQSPGVRFDPPYTEYNICEDQRGSYIYVNLNKMEKLDEDAKFHEDVERVVNYTEKLEE